MFGAPQEPEILNDKNRLQDIYNLRVVAYEFSDKAQLVNREKFPKGWYDSLDELNNTVHWIIKNQFNEIIASARLVLLEDIAETGEPFDQFDLPSERPFAYWSRLVVHPDYRNFNLMQKLDKLRFEYLKDNDIPFAVCCVTSERHLAIKRLGFKYLGDFYYNWQGKSRQVIQGFCLIVNR